METEDCMKGLRPVPIKAYDDMCSRVSEVFSDL